MPIFFILFFLMGFSLNSNVLAHSLATVTDLAVHTKKIMRLPDCTHACSVTGEPCIRSEYIDSAPYIIAPADGLVHCYQLSKNLSGEITVETDKIGNDVYIFTNGYALDGDITLTGNNKNRPDGPTVYVINNRTDLIAQSKITGEITAQGTANADYYRLTVVSGITLDSEGVAGDTTNNTISIESKAVMHGDINIADSVDNPTITVDAATIQGNIFGGNIGNTITLQNQAIVSEDIKVGNGPNALTVIGASNLEGCFTLGAPITTLTISADGHASPCASPSIPGNQFVEWGCCKDDNLGKVIFYGNGSSIRAYANNQWSEPYPVVALPQKYSDHAFYWFDDTHVLMVFTSPNALLYSVLYDSSHNTFQEIKIILPKEAKRNIVKYTSLRSIKQPSSLVAWHVEQKDGAWNPEEQYLGTCFTTGNNEISFVIYKVTNDFANQNINLKILSQCLAPSEINNELAYLTWQPTLSTQDNPSAHPLVLVGLNSVGAQLVAVPFDPKDSKKQIQAVIPTGVTVPLGPTVFASPKYFNLAGQSGVQQVLQQYTVSTKEDSSVSFSLVGNIIELPIDQFGTVSRLRCCNGSDDAPVFVSFVAPTGTSLFANVTIDHNNETYSINKYPSFNYDALTLNYTDLAPQCLNGDLANSQYNIVGLLAGFGANQVWQFLCSSPTECSATNLSLP